LQGVQDDAENLARGGQWRDVGGMPSPTREDVDKRWAVVDAIDKQIEEVRIEQAGTHTVLAPSQIHVFEGRIGALEARRPRLLREAKVVSQDYQAALAREMAKLDREDARKEAHWRWVVHMVISVLAIVATVWVTRFKNPQIVVNPPNVTVVIPGPAAMAPSAALPATSAAKDTGVVTP
jgi:hypothetical protein